MPYTYDPSPCLMDLINSADSATAEIQALSQLGEIIDGHEDYLAHAIVLLAIINERAAHLDRLLSQLSACLLPRPHAVEEDAR